AVVYLIEVVLLVIRFRNPAVEPCIRQSERRRSRVEAREHQATAAGFAIQLRGTAYVAATRRDVECARGNHPHVAAPAVLDLRVRRLDTLIAVYLPADVVLYRLRSTAHRQRALVDTPVPEKGLPRIGAELRNVLAHDRTDGLSGAQGIPTPRCNHRGAACGIIRRKTADNVREERLALLGREIPARRALRPALGDDLDDAVHCVSSVQRCRRCP